MCISGKLKNVDILVLFQKVQGVVVNVQKIADP